MNEWHDPFIVKSFVAFVDVYADENTGRQRCNDDRRFELLLEKRFSAFILNESRPANDLPSMSSFAASS